MNYLRIIDSFYAWLGGLPQVQRCERGGLLALRAEILLQGKPVTMLIELIPDKPGDDSLILELNPVPQWTRRFIDHKAANDSACYGIDSWSEGGRHVDAMRLYFALAAEVELLQVEAWLEQLVELEGPHFEPARIDIFTWLAQNA